MKRHRNNPERGATIVEAAVVLLLLFTFILASLEFGRAYNIYQVMTDAAREGARFSVAPYTQTSTLPNSSAVSAKVNAFLSSANVRGATVTVNQSVSQTYNAVPLTFTRVDVAAPYTFLFFKFGTVTMTTRAVMRNETN